jgi:hypothetical protein
MPRLDAGTNRDIDMAVMSAATLEAFLIDKVLAVKRP